MASNVELVRSVHAASERGDFTSVEWAHPEIEFAIAEARRQAAGRDERQWPRLGAST